MKPEIIQETLRLWEAEPDKAKGKPAVKARSDQTQAVMEHGAFTWRADLPPPVGGSNEAPSPTALLLSALAGCAVVFTRDTLAPQLGVRVTDVSAEATCEADARGLLGMEGAVPDLQNIQLSIEITSPDPEEEVQKVYRAWKERCPIYLALIKAVPVSTTLEVRSS